MEKLKDALGIVALAFNLTQIQTILGIILTVVNLLVVLINYGCKLYDKITTKDIKGIQEDTKELETKVNEIKEDLKNGNK